MPNYTWNQLTIIGDDKKLNELENTKFDFNKFIPMPDEIKKDSQGKVCLLCNKKMSKEKFREYCEKCGIESNIGGRSDKNLNEKELEIKNNWIKKYGATGWYEWSVNNWGTKWNSVDVTMHRLNPNKLLVEFDTAWSQPDPIIQVIARDYEVRVYHMFEDEFDYETRVNKVEHYNYDE